jgi:hypothetical protein
VASTTDWHRHGRFDRTPVRGDASGVPLRRFPTRPPAASWVAAEPNPFGITEAVLGLLVGWVLSSVAVGIFGTVSGHPKNPGTFGSDVTNLIGLWCGLAGAALLAARRRRGATATARAGAVTGLSATYGLSFRLLDLPLGIAVGVASQYLLAPLLELPLLPFVPHLYHRLGQPARSLTSGVSGGGLVVLGLLICAGSPFFEELFFRGLLLRGLLGRLERHGVTASALASIVITGIVFGLVHFEPLQLIALCGFGMVLSYLAVATGRLGPGMVAHAAFNATTFVALASLH